MATGNELASQYADWKAPKGDGQWLLWPEPVRLIEQTLANQKSLSKAGARVQGVPLSDWRREARRFVGVDDQTPLVATGHQAELHHAGVWVKNLVINALGGRMGGRAFHFAVDTDEPKHLNLRWPVAGGQVSLAVTDDPALTTAAWSGQLASPSPMHVKRLEAQFLEASSGWGFEPMAGQVLATLRTLSMEEPPLPAATTNAVHQLDWSLGLRHDALLLSPMLETDAWLALAHHLMSRAGEVAGAYNAALADYRRINGISSPGRPMPDLNVSPDQADLDDRPDSIDQPGSPGAASSSGRSPTLGRVEAPLWFDDLSTGVRRRGSVTRLAEGWSLEHAGEAIVLREATPAQDAVAELRRFCRQTGLRIAPRAITLTMFIRLMLADQFVHGIGGGRYDQVTDLLIRRLWDIQPPAFSVATATLYFPAAVGRTRACVPCVMQEGHQLRHRLLGQRKTELVDAIASAPRRSARRRELFATMHRELADARKADPRLDAWRGRLADVKARWREEQTLFDRELFYAMQPRARLEAMIEQYHSAITK